MVQDNKYDLTDLVVSAIEQKPLDFENTFNDLFIDRLRSAVEEKKIAIAQQMYGYSADSEDSDIEENEDGQEFE